MAALECLKDRNANIAQIILTKPIVEITSQRGLGALPGELDEKTSPYYAHFYDNIIKLIGPNYLKTLKDNGFIKEVLSNFMRGMTFGQTSSDGKAIGAIAIIDESQNFTVHEIKTIISRMGENSKLVIMGDIDQVDLKLQRGEKCGLEDCFDRFQGILGIEFIEFTEDDIVRDPFLIEIMKRYKNNI